MRFRKGWKVTNWEGWSVWARPFGHGAVRYLVVKWVEPRPGNGPLCVFDDYDEAYSFAQGWGGVVHECEYRASRFRRIWWVLRGKKQVMVNMAGQSNALALPYKTALASAVRLLN